MSAPKKVTREMILAKLAKRAGTRIYHDDKTKRSAVKQYLGNPGTGYAISYDLGIRPTVLYTWSQDPRFGGVPKSKRAASKRAASKGAKRATRKGAKGATRKGAKRATRKSASQRKRPTLTGAKGSSAQRFRFR